MEKNCALSATKKNILTLVLSENKFLNETKNHNPPCKLNGWSLKWDLNFNFFYRGTTYATNHSTQYVVISFSQCMFFDFIYTR